MRKFLSAVLLVGLLSGCSFGDTVSSTSSAMKEANAARAEVYGYNGFGALESFEEVKAELRAQYGENKPITDGNYDKLLAVKCVNGTFVGRKTENVIAFKGIPFVGRQPVGNFAGKPLLILFLTTAFTRRITMGKPLARWKLLVKMPVSMFRGKTVFI